MPCRMDKSLPNQGAFYGLSPGAFVTKAIISMIRISQSGVSACSTMKVHQRHQKYIYDTPYVLWQFMANMFRIFVMIFVSILRIY